MWLLCLSSLCDGDGGDGWMYVQCPKDAGVLVVRMLTLAQGSGSKSAQGEELPARPPLLSPVAHANTQ